jgi:hypothetical protein
VTWTCEAVTYLSEFRTYLKTRTDAPEAFHTYAGLCSLAVAIGVSCWMHGAARQVYPNLNCVILAPSGMGKSVPLDMSANILRRAGLGDRILPTSFSQEALLEQLSQHPIGIFILQEFAAFQSLLGRDYNSGAEQTLTELYDVPDEYQRKLRKSEGFTLRYPCVTILGASSPDWFAQAFKGNSLRGGWLARFLFCPSREAGEPIGDPGPRDDRLEDMLAGHLRRVQDLHGVFEASKVRGLYNEFAQRCRMSARESMEFGGMRSRMPLMAQKVAMLTHVSRDPSTLTLSEQDMQAAISFVERAYEGAEDYLTNEVAYDKKDADRLRIVDIVRSKGGCVPWSTALKNSHMDARDFDQAVKTLADNGSLVVDTIRPKSLRLPDVRNFAANSREFGEFSNGHAVTQSANFAKIREPEF